jgi:inner membrane protein
MDNFCHTLVGLAMGEAGLRRKTRYGNAAQVIAANVPDVDVLVFLTNTPSVEFRRGWTHGIVAQLLLPVLTTAAIVAFDRLRPRRGADAVRRCRCPGSLRWRTPGCTHTSRSIFSTITASACSRPWTGTGSTETRSSSSMCGSGWRSRQASGCRGAQPYADAGAGALVFAAGYAVAMLVSAQVARGVVADLWRTSRGTEPRALMVGPLPLTPFTRAVIVDAGDHYENRDFSWWSSSVAFSPDRIPRERGDPAVAVARQSR